MSSSIAQKKQHGVPDHPARFGASLAHVITVENNQDVVLGQAWLSGSNTLVTCGHVVEKFANSPGSLIARFPSSGNSYTVLEVRMHPNFASQADQFVRYDAAVLIVDLRFPEREAVPLPIEYEKNISINQEYSAVRYPIHLGQFTSRPNPLAQIGHMLGPLRKNDNFHLLHDLALAPGDSGSPIFDGNSVVALHCGDTATLPGLNLPTTSIRLALWVDALRELGVEENQPKTQSKKLVNLLTAAALFLVSFFAIITIMGTLRLNQASDSPAQWEVKDPKLNPIVITYNQSFSTYQYDDVMDITVRVDSPCYLYVLIVTADDKVFLVYPGYKEDDQILEAGQKRSIEQKRQFEMRVGPSKDKMHIFALKSEKANVKEEEKQPPIRDPKTGKLIRQPLTVSGSELIKRIMAQGKADPTSIQHFELDLPTADRIPAFVEASTKKKPAPDNMPKPSTPEKAVPTKKATEKGTSPEKPTSTEKPTEKPEKPTSTEKPTEKPEKPTSTGKSTEKGASPAKVPQAQTKPTPPAHQTIPQEPAPSAPTKPSADKATG